MIHTITLIHMHYTRLHVMIWLSFTWCFPMIDATSPNNFNLLFSTRLSLYWFSFYFNFITFSFPPFSTPLTSTILVIIDFFSIKLSLFSFINDFNWVDFSFRNSHQYSLCYQLLSLIKFLPRVLQNLHPQKCSLLVLIVKKIPLPSLLPLGLLWT